MATRKEPARPEVTAETPLGDVLDFMKILWGLDHNLQRVSKAMAASLGVTGPQRLVLRIVSLFPDVSAGRLASVLRLHPSSVTVLLNRLEGDGFLTRRQDPGDGRRVKLRVTARGQRVVAKNDGTVEGAMSSCLKDFPPEKLRVTAEVLAAVGAQLEEAARKPPATPRRARRAVSEEPARARKPRK